MKNRLKTLSTVLIRIVFAAGHVRAAGSSPVSPMRVVALRCEHRVTPLGIENPSPLLSWQLQDERRDARQTAYQLIAARTPILLQDNRGDLWDSGKVVSEQSHLVAYAGQPLTSAQRVYWKVRVWDQNGQPTEYSEAAYWEMGLLQPTDWRGAQWIGSPRNHDIPNPVKADEAGDWIWGADTGRSHIELQRIFSLPRKAVVRADLIANTSDPETLIEVSVNGVVPRGNAVNGVLKGVFRPVEFDATTWLKPGEENTLTISTRKVGALPAVTLGLRLVFGDGTTELIRTDHSWRCRVLAAARNRAETPDGEGPENPSHLPGLTSPSWCWRRMVTRGGASFIVVRPWRCRPPCCARISF